MVATRGTPALENAERKYVWIVTINACMLYCCCFHNCFQYLLCYKALKDSLLFEGYLTFEPFRIFKPLSQPYYINNFNICNIRDVSRIFRIYLL